MQVPRPLRVPPEEFDRVQVTEFALAEVLKICAGGLEVNVCSDKSTLPPTIQLDALLKLLIVSCHFYLVSLLRHVAERFLSRYMLLSQTFCS